MDASSLVHVFIELLIIGCVFWLLWWLVAYIAPPEPFAKILRVVLAIVAVLLLINWLLGLGGAPMVRWR